MDLRLVSTPLTKTDKLAVVSVADLKVQARVPLDDTSEDTLIADDIETAYDYLAGRDGWLGRCCLLTESWEWYTPGPTLGRLELPMRPVVAGSVVIDYLGTDGATYEPLDLTLFDRPVFEPFLVYQSSSRQLWPITALTPHPRAYRVRFDAGFGEAEYVPSVLRKSIKLLAAHWYKNREATGETGRTVAPDIEYGVKKLAGRYKIAKDPS